jgi:hypothetical protein
MFPGNFFKIIRRFPGESCEAKDCISWLAKIGHSGAEFRHRTPRQAKGGALFRRKMVVFGLFYRIFDPSNSLARSLPICLIVRFNRLT